MSSPRVTLHDLRQAVAADPANAARAYDLGRALGVRREYGAAVECLRRATQLDPSCARYFFELGEVLRGEERWELAIEADRAGVTLAPYDWTGLASLGRKYERVGQDAEAIDAFVRAIASRPNFLPACTGLCRMLVVGRTAEEAAALARASVGENVPPVLLRIALGHGLESHGRYHEALECWTRAEKEYPAAPDVLTGIARAHMTLGDLAAAEEAYARALRMHPDETDVVVNYIGWLFRRGRIDDLRQFVREPGPNRILAHGYMPAQPSDAPKWDGTQDLSGKTMLIECTGGSGDVINFCRFAPLLTQRGARIVLQCPTRVASLVRTMPGADEVVAPFDACSPFDYQCLPELLALRLPWDWPWVEQSIPYVRVDPARRHAWRQRLDDRFLNVGLVWRSLIPEYHDPYLNRSMPAAEYRRLAVVPGVRLYGLQKGPGAAEVTARDGDWLTANWGEESGDFSDAAAAMQALDAVVTVDTGPAHVAGALGKTTFVLLPRSPNMAWMAHAPSFEDGGRSAWYPSARLYRQQQAGEWRPLVSRIAADLGVLACARRGALEGASD